MIVVSSFAAQNYRCHPAIELEIDDYTVLIGANGAGKSTVLYALEWFFEGGPLTASDANAEAFKADPNLEIWVEVVFESDGPWPGHLEKFAVGDSCVLRRIFAIGDKSDRLVASRMAHPDFAAARMMGSADELRLAYDALRTTRCPTLPELPKRAPKADVLGALDTWEEDPANADRLLRVWQQVDTSIAAEFVQFVLIRASGSVSEELAFSGRSSVIDPVVRKLVSAIESEAKTRWLEKYQRHVDALGRYAQMRVGGALREYGNEVSDALSAFVSESMVSFRPSSEGATINLNISVETQVESHNSTSSVASQGHGVQRAVMIAAVQALAKRSDSRARPILLAVEEPEIYQHPTRARHFAKVLRTLSLTPGAQVAIATHSPYFVHPSQFAKLRRLEIGTPTRVVSLLPATIAQLSGIDEGGIEKAIEQRLPTSFSECFFASKALLVDTDRTFWEVILDRLGTPLEGLEISLYPVGGKSNLRIVQGLLAGFGVQTYVIADADYLGAGRHPIGSERYVSAMGSNKAATEKMVDWMTFAGSLELADRFVFGDGTLVGARAAILHDDLEHELAGWSSLVSLFDQNNESLAGKDVARYRLHASAADLGDLPANIVRIAEAVRAFALC